MITQMIIRIDSQIKRKPSKLARGEGKTTSQVIRELIENHIKEKDIDGYIDDLWDRIGGKLKAKGINQKAINRAGRESRESR